MPIYRIDRIISDMSIAPRRQVKSYIKAGRISVNGKLVNRPDEKYDTETALIEVDGELIHYEEFVYFMLNKPSGVISATRDDKEKTVIDLLEEKHRKPGLFPVGRLDKDTEGLLILTNDGVFAHKVTSPKHGVKKKYYLETEIEIPDGAQKLLRKGAILSDGTKCLPAELEILSPCSCYLEITEGKYHQVKRMMASIGAGIIYLKRIAIGNLELDDDLKPGQYRQMNKCELMCIL